MTRGALQLNVGSKQNEVGLAGTRIVMFMDFYDYTNTSTYTRCPQSSLMHMWVLLHPWCCRCITGSIPKGGVFRRHPCILSTLRGISCSCRRGGRGLLEQRTR